MFRCPRCSFPLQTHGLRGRFLHTCMRCRGFFLDDAEVRERFGSPATWQARGQGRRRGDSSLRCPRDLERMEAHEFGEDSQGLVVDVCAECSGLWLDRGEGHRLRDALATLAPRPAKGVSPAVEAPGLLTYVFQVFTGFPIEVWNPVTRRIWLVPSLLAANLLIHVVVTLVAGESSGAMDPFLFRRFGLIPESLLHGQGIHTLLTHVFFHVGWMHLAGNLYFLWVFGDNVEDRLGAGRTAAVFLTAGVAGALAHTLMNPAGEIPLVGSSGAISGLMGAYLILFPRVRLWVVVFFIRFALPVVFYLLFWVGWQAIQSTVSTEPVAWFAHIGGFAAGTLMALMLRDTGRSAHLFRAERQARHTRGGPASRH